MAGCSPAPTWSWNRAPGQLSGTRDGRTRHALHGTSGTRRRRTASYARPPPEGLRARLPLITTVRVRVVVAVSACLAPVVVARPRVVRLAVWPPGGAVVDLRGLPGGARDIRSHYVGSVPVQAAAGPVVGDRGSRVSMGGCLLDVAQRHPGIQTGSERFTSHAQWAWSGAGSGRYSSGLVMPGS